MRSRPPWLPCLVTLALAAPVEAPGQPGDSAVCERGVMLALAGETARAESTFLSLLSAAPRDARALNNLGNLQVLAGDPRLALAFYDRALRTDSTDAGIHLNRAAVYLLLGERERALAAAEAGVRRAGGEREAARLMGLRDEPARPGAKAAAAPALHRQEVRDLLRAAIARVPSDSARTRAATTPPPPGGAPRTWRSAGPRGAEGSDAAAVLYWKR